MTPPLRETHSLLVVRGACLVTCVGCPVPFTCRWCSNLIIDEISAPLDAAARRGERPKPLEEMAVYIVSYRLGREADLFGWVAS